MAYGEWDSAAAFGTMTARYSENQNELEGNSTIPDSTLAARGCAGLDDALVSDLLAHMGREQLPATVRCRDDSHMHRNMGEEQLADFEPGSFRASG
jgi:hypothetical protein